MIMRKCNFRSANGNECMLASLIPGRTFPEEMRCTVAYGGRCILLDNVIQGECTFKTKDNMKMCTIKRRGNPTDNRSCDGEKKCKLFKRLKKIKIDS